MMYDYSGKEILDFEMQISALQTQVKVKGVDPYEKEDLKEEVSDLKEQLKEAWQIRIDGWKESFKKSTDSDWGEMFYTEFGCNFKTPTKTQIKQVLQCLDRDHPGWDDSRNAEPFFATLAENCPELIRPAQTKAPRKRAKRVPTKKAGGCIVALAAVPFFGIFLMLCKNLFF